MEVYLDNSATTLPRNEVIEEMNLMFTKFYGNPSSLHRMGLEAEKRIKKAREFTSDFLKVRSDEIFFTSGGTESNNIAIQGIVNKYSRQGNHLITTKIEHPSVLNIFKKYEGRGFNVTYLDVNKNGLIDLDRLEECINEKTTLVSIMLVNNEIGTIQPIEKVREVLTKKNTATKLHVDGVQAFGKIELNLKKLGIDTFAFSGHKIHGPKGIGGLYVKKDLKFEPIIYGGNQERGLRVGTENVPGIVGLGKAIEILSENFNEEMRKLIDLKKYFVELVSSKIDNIKINSFPDDRCAPHIVNISFIGVRGEVLLHYLEEAGIYVSTGSACSSRNSRKSHVLNAIGLKDNEIEGTVRFSFSYSNTKEEIDYAVNKLEKAINEIRKITMR